MYQYQNNILSIPARLLYKDWALMSYNTYKSYCSRGKLVRTKEGRGKDNEAWVSFHDLSPIYKEICFARIGDPKEVLVVNLLEEYIVPDIEATKFFTRHRTPSGKSLSSEKQREKATNCMILNAITSIFTEKGVLAKKFGKQKTKIWERVSESVNAINTDKWQCSLPNNPRSLKRRYDKYLKESYGAFIHGGEGSINSRRVTADVESLIVSLYCLPSKPYSSVVHDLYLQFLGGAIEVVDYKTGEIFNREDFYVNESPVEISESTIWNYINLPRNQLLIKKYRNGAYDFNHKQRPHVNRTAPNYSMSKITLDDRDIMHTKLHNGKRVMAYYAFDDLSGAMIGISHSLEKNHDLYLNCIRDMFRFTSNKGLGVPMQMEVEHHLVSDFKDGLMKAGNIFPFVRWCNPTNSQEKYAERLIGTKKYGVEKNNNQGVGRFYARGDSNRTTSQKIFDAENNNYKFSKATYKVIVANDLQEQLEYNNQLHPNQKKYQGMSRMDVFIHHVNPDLPQLDRGQLAKYIGFKTQTSIRRSQYVTVQYEKFQLENPAVLNQLASNNYNVDAYYLPTETNEINEVFIYQNDLFICECQPVPTFNRANAEWTDKDVQGYQDATKYISQFDKMVKTDTEQQLRRVAIIKNDMPIIDVTPEIVKTVAKIEEFEYEAFDEVSERNNAIDDL
ncbi:hypothetical protein [Tenacibaculum finnmarkense]|uniref:hypothetical protein n=1 Tax=Tenacibaculum finnmarkense TaxID=2781243 RepID=UPI001E4254FA|nr:hypothetical protein [Tenacibaculum finnmarkense]MCD8412765.1 hypothetical protein [Tenacibaculum finnmarkense genomovar ulcerans]